ncbi:short chain dehydrogenase [Polaribacter reichenbachii]|uniref:Short-chain dehydrogenase n=1 Tax=Polaribacter reichenbachii TaxID=996801 RepID=A0A1B8TYX9_9FLAO|nr:SDR family oxidoreductase [Polaribacter reichenbachii]APZ45862.1 short chain dehydrogenase [Polaribacter reichenbachii]AUC19724.1 short chain dehydrogenase [Polaribacter reichenbachii]OBY64705.1 short-chain dehydrogenase [Polaribacter reichenbachii]
MSFNDKIIWITGASSGIGKALAIQLSNQNAKLILSSRKKEGLELVKNQCKNKDDVKIITLDLEDYSNLQHKADEAIAVFGKVDILINNGGISQRSFASETNIEVDKRIMDINYLGTVALTKAILPHFIKNKNGHFVVTTSIVGKIGTPLRSSYAASKHALHGFFDSLRAEQHQNKIAVTLVCPGFVNTNVSKNALTGDGTPQEKMDVATENGIQPERFAKLMAKAIKNRKEEVYIAGVKEKLGVYVKRFFPKIFSVMVRKLSVT